MRYLLSRSGEGRSDLMQGEADQWYMGMNLSAAVFAGFILSAVLAVTPYQYMTPYDVGVLLSPDQPMDSVVAQDELRQKLGEALAATGLEPWLTLHFSAQEKWL